MKLTEPNTTRKQVSLRKAFWHVNFVEYGGRQKRSRNVQCLVIIIRVTELSQYLGVQFRGNLVPSIRLLQLSSCFVSEPNIARWIQFAGRWRSTYCRECWMVRTSAPVRNFPCGIKFRYCFLNVGMTSWTAYMITLGYKIPWKSNLGYRKHTRSNHAM